MIRAEKRERRDGDRPIPDLKRRQHQGRGHERTREYHEGPAPAPASCPYPVAYYTHPDRDQCREDSLAAHSEAYQGVRRGVALEKNRQKNRDQRQGQREPKSGEGLAGSFGQDRFYPRRSRNSPVVTSPCRTTADPGGRDQAEILSEQVMRPRSAYRTRPHRSTRNRLGRHKRPQPSEDRRMRSGRYFAAASSPPRSPSSRGSQEGLDVFRPQVPVVDVVGMLPDVMVSSAVWPCFRGRSALAVLTTLSFPPSSTSQAQPDPNCVTAACENSVLKSSNDPKLASIAWPRRRAGRRRHLASCSSSRRCGSRPGRHC